MESGSGNQLDELKSSFKPSPKEREPKRKIRREKGWKLEVQPYVQGFAFKIIYFVSSLSLVWACPRRKKRGRAFGYIFFGLVFKNEIKKGYRLNPSRKSCNANTNVFQ